MKKRDTNFAIITACLCALAMVVSISGCSTLSSSGNTDTSSPPAESASAETDAGALVAPADDENAPVYHDFGDIMVPKGLNVVKKDSLVMTSGGVTSGILVLRGNVDVDSLSNFFESKMPVDGWRKMGSFRSARSIFLFEKATRWCVIAVSDGSFNSKVEIWVAPIDKQQTASGVSR